MATGCAQFPQPSPLAAQADVANANRCAGSNSLTDAQLSARIDMAAVILTKIREATGKSNEQICVMQEPEINKVMLADRAKYRNADRTTLRAPAKEFIRQWDADDYGRLPNATQLLAAETARKQLASGRRQGGVGEGALSLAAGISNGQWSALGPGNIGGRVRSIVIDSRNQNRIFIGAATGGIWLTENAGQSYRAITDFIGNLAIGALAMDPSNPNVLYAGTGESFTGLAGIGMFKSTDGGVTWNFLNSTTTDTAVNPLGNEWGGVNRIAISPANPNLVLAATTRGSNLTQGAIMRSIDGGNSWTRIQLAPGTVVTISPPNVLDVKFDPNDPSNMVAGAENGHAYYSRDAGASWTQSTALISVAHGRNASARVELAYAKNRPNLVYMSLDNGPSATAARGEIWKSEDGGVTWTMLSSPAHLSEQGDYDNTIWVDPTNENHILTGGLDLYQSMDGGVNFARVSTWQQAGPGAPQPHADHHTIVSVPNFSDSNPIVYFGNDGGVYRANNIFGVSASGSNSWQNLNNGLAVTQFYGGAGKRAAGGKIIGGTQDNGTLVYSAGTNWSRFAGGDGGFVAVDPIDDSTLYGEYVYASVHRTINLAARTYICDGITEALKNTGGNIYCGTTATEQANFISPFILDPNNNQRMLVGTNSLWVSNNVKDPVPTWTTIKSPVVPASAGDKPYISAVAVAEKDSNVIWASHNASGNTSGQVWKTVNGLSAAPAWTRVGASALPTGTVNRITIDPDNSNRVWVVYSGFAAARIWTTTDGGNTWSNIHSNLPNVTLHDMKRHPSQSNWLYVASANGIYTSENGGQTWSASNDGPASVRVRELFWYDPSTLVAATYGRGMFRATVAGAGPQNYSDLWWAGTAENGWGMSIQQHGQTQLNAMYVYDNAGKPTWYVLPGGAWNSNFTTYAGPVYQPTSAPLNSYTAAQFKVGAPVGNISINFTSNSTATLQYVINGVSGQKSIQRQIFGRGTSPIQVGDMWWGGTAQNGWGLSITQQAGILFGAWFTYGPDGKPTWYAMTDGTWSGNTYTGGFVSTLSSAWLGTPYNASQLQAAPTGTMTLNFSDANNATMTYTFTAGPFAGTTQTKPIVRQPY
jgi:photosystem II stability/assembly factor-like uncharacterized protein